MIEPVRPQDASGIYRRQFVAPAAEEAARAARRNVPGAPRRVDRIDISTQGKALLDILDTVRAQPELRAARMAELRAQLDDGTYRTSAQAIARALLAEGQTESTAEGQDA